MAETAGANFYITGVQLEAGPVATPFERRPYSVELGMAKRYYNRLDFSTTGNVHLLQLTGRSASVANGYIGFGVPMRTNTPALSATGPITALLPGLGTITFSGGLGATARGEGIMIEALGGNSLTTGYPALLSAGFLEISAEL